MGVSVHLSITCLQFVNSKAHAEHNDCKKGHAVKMPNPEYAHLHFQDYIFNEQYAGNVNKTSTLIEQQIDSQVTYKICASATKKQ